ncbi:MAG: hypothetical protein K2X72_03155 [Reyranella sp.]|nr:hypothetical protein [Reyranella sp.]
MDRQSLSVDRLIRRELTLLRSLGRDRRTASARLTPLIRSGPAALAARPALRRKDARREPTLISG